MRIFGSTIKELAEGRRFLIFAFRQGDKIKEEETDMQHGLKYRQCTQNFYRKM
jgi:hypothetical protein